MYPMFCILLYLASLVQNIQMFMEIYIFLCAVHAYICVCVYIYTLYICIYICSHLFIHSVFDGCLTVIFCLGLL